jgi:hypothetical protein
MGVGHHLIAVANDKAGTQKAKTRAAEALKVPTATTERLISATVSGKSAHAGTGEQQRKTTHPDNEHAAQAPCVACFTG